MPANDFLALREPLVTVLRAAGDIARATARGPFKRWTKGADHSPVTEADIAVNEFLRDALSDLVRDAGWKSEESTPDQPDRAVPACVDSRSNRWHPRVIFPEAPTGPFLSRSPSTAVL